MSKGKISLDLVKLIPDEILNLAITIAKNRLKKDPTMKKIFEKYNETVDLIDYIPTIFSDLDVSAKTDHGIIYLNYCLLADGDFLEDYQYLIHEYTHWAQQCLGEKPTKSADDGNYLDNKYEQEGFANQLEFVHRQYGEEKVNKYIDDLLDHHNIKNKKEIKEKTEILKSKI